MLMAKPLIGKKYYIAFSIHGTNTFIVATNVMTDRRFATLEKAGYRITASRRKDAEGIKLTWRELSTKQGEPLRSAPHVLFKFKQLEKAGWTIIGREEFIKRHWNKTLVK